MNLCGCQPVSSEPTIPVILRGRRRKPSTLPSQSPNAPLIQDIQNRQQWAFSQPISVPSLSLAQNIKLVYACPPPPVLIQKVVVPSRLTGRRMSLGGEGITGGYTRSDGRSAETKMMSNCKETQWKQQNIRKTLDKNLSNIYNTINEKTKTNNVRHIAGNVVVEAPKLSTDLLRDYIRLVYSQYQLADPTTFNTSPATPRVLQNKRASRKHTGWRAVQLKESIVAESTGRHSSPYATLRHMSKQFTADPDRSKLQTEFITQLPEQPNKQNTQIQEIKQIYRYCFICEQPILQANILFHEKYRCPEFVHLQQLGFDQIRRTLLNKIRRIYSQTQQLQQMVFESQCCHKTISQIQRLKYETRNYLSSIDTNISEEPKANKGQIRTNFDIVMGCYEDNYFKLYQNLRKLQWFHLMLANLEQKYHGGDRESSPQYQAGVQLHKQSEFSTRRHSLA